MNQIWKPNHCIEGLSVTRVGRSFPRTYKAKRFRGEKIKFPLTLELQIRGLDFPTEQDFSPFPCTYVAKSLKNYMLKFSAIPEITARSKDFPTESGFNLACIHHFLPICCFGPKLLHSSSQKTKVGHVCIRE